MIESAHDFAFGASWQHVECWDKCRAYQLGIGTVQGLLDDKAEGTKAVDFVGVRNGRLWLIEAKDFRNRQLELKKRVPELPLEMALKARDSMAGLVGAGFDRDAGATLTALFAAIASREPPVVVAIIALPRPSAALPDSKLALHRQVLTDQIKQRLKWLTRRAMVIAPDECAAKLDLIVTSAAQS